MAKSYTSLPFAPRGGKSLGTKPPAAKGKVKSLKPRRRQKPRKAGKKTVALMGNQQKGY